MNRRTDIPLEGELNCWTRGYDLPDILVAIRNTRKTGLLRFVSTEAEKTLFVRNGETIFASSSSEDDRLGEYLLRQGKITLQDLHRFAHQVRPGKRLGTLLVEDGLLEPKELVQAVIGQVRAIILSLFRWTEAWYGFNEQELPGKETITLNMPTARLILDGVRLIDSWRRIAQGVGDMRSVYRRVAGNEETLRSVELDTTTLGVLAMLSRPHSVEESCASSQLPDIDVCRMIWVFRCLGWIELAEREPAAVGATTPVVEAAAAPLDHEPAQAVEVTAATTEDVSFDIVEGEPLANGEASQTTFRQSAREEDLPLVTAIPLAGQEGAETPEPLISPSLADLSSIGVDEPGGRGSEREMELGDPFGPPERLSFSEDSPLSTEEGGGLPGGSGPEEPSGKAPKPLVPSKQDSRDAAGVESPPEREASRKPAALDEDDMDLEGLGMVLGDRGGE